MISSHHGTAFLTLMVLVGISACQEPSRAPSETHDSVPEVSSLPPQDGASHLGEPIISVKTEPEPLMIEGEVKPPQFLSGEALQLFDNSCQSTGARGRLRRVSTLIIRAVVDRDGRVTDVSFPKYGRDACLKEYVQGQLSAWRFEPATLDGEPVAVYFDITNRIEYGRGGSRKQDY